MDPRSKPLTPALMPTSMPCPTGSRPSVALLAAKDHVNVFLYDGAIVPDPEGIITAGGDNSTARTVAVRQGETINAHALTAMIKHIIANNRAGGWRKVKREADHGS